MLSFCWWSKIDSFSYLLGCVPWFQACYLWRRCKNCYIFLFPLLVLTSVGRLAPFVADIQALLCNFSSFCFCFSPRSSKGLAHNIVRWASFCNSWGSQLITSVPLWALVNEQVPLTIFLNVLSYLPKKKILICASTICMYIYIYIFFLISLISYTLYIYGMHYTHFCLQLLCIILGKVLNNVTQA